MAAKKSSKVSKTTQESVLEVDPAFPQIYSKGSQREYLITAPPATLTRTLLSSEYVILAGLIAVSLAVRCRDLLLPKSVVFDEVHFGGFARKYILGEFFMDVHPPLTKMLFAAVGSLSGYDGKFLFEKIGDAFPTDVVFPYYMRLFPALLGVGTIILCYLTLRASGCRPIVCLFTAALLLVENANVTISRYILLDSPLMFFIAASIYGLKKFEIQKPFLLAWFKALIVTGISLGLALSLKWVGLFTVAWVGLSTLYLLWFVIGDLSISSRQVVSHFVARGLAFLAIPITLYLVLFSVHFDVLSKDGEGSAFMSSPFRATLQGNKIPKDVLGNVGLYSTVTLKQKYTENGYLHSHSSFYPAGSKQQQITLYPHLDSNNNWLIEPYNQTEQDVEGQFVPLTRGMKIRLKHINTERRLHSHDEKPPVSERDWEKEVSCYGYKGFGGDYNDDFIVEVVDKESAPDAIDNVKAIKTVFRLRHAMSGHYLFAGGNKLPTWGFEQNEVTCASQGYRPLTYWYFETNINSLVPEADKEIVNYDLPGFWGKFVEMNKRMWSTNQGLTGHHSWQLDPQEWPLLLRGINYWVKDHRQIYFLGNAPVWWLLTAAIVFFIVYAGVELLKWQTGAKVAGDKNLYNFNTQAFLYFVGWALHYFPFFIMGRQLFLHHYLPAGYFGLLLFGHFFEVLFGYFGSKFRAAKPAVYILVATVLVSAVVFFFKYSPLIYGEKWTVAQCEALKFANWDFDCKNFLADIPAYEAYDISAAAASASSAAAATTTQLSPAVSELVATPDVAPPKEEEPVQDVEKSTEGKASASPAAEEEPVEQVVPQFEVEGTPKNENSAVEAPVVESDEAKVEVEEAAAPEPVAEPVAESEAEVEAEEQVFEDSAEAPVDIEAPGVEYVDSIDPRELNK